MISEKKIHFQILQIFGNLEIDFSISRKFFFDKLSVLSELGYFFVQILTHTAEKIVFDKLSVLSELHYFFLQILTHYRRDLKHAVTKALRQGYSLMCIYGCMLFYYPKVTES